MSVPLPVAKDPKWPAGAVLVVVDVQNAFVEETAWHVPGLADKVADIGSVTQIAGPERTLLTLFRPARRLVGSWRHYYRTFANMRDPKSQMWSIAPDLVGRGQVVEKSTYSAFGAHAFVSAIHRLRPRVLAVCGAETDICVLATVQDAIDRGVPVCILQDLCLSSDEAGHEAAFRIWRRLPEQVALVNTSQFLAKGETLWRN